MSTQNMSFNNSTLLRGLLHSMGIQPFLDNKSLTEIVINRPNEIWTESSEGWVKHDMPDLSFSSLKKLANVFAVYNRQEINQDNPICSGVMPDGQRGQAVIPSACERNTVSFVVRRPSDTRFSLSDYINTKRLDRWVDKSSFITKGEMILPDDVARTEAMQRGEIERLNKELGIPEDVHLQLFELEMLQAKAVRDIEKFIEIAVLNKQNFVLVGGTGSGKTTFTKAICDIVPLHTRIITIEDTAELDLPNHPNKVHLFYKEVSAKDLLKSCLRMKPDRIFLTELRGDEAWDYLSALNTGHAGSITTVHANDCASAYYRVGSLIKQSEVGQKLDFEYVMNEVFTTLDVVMYMEHTYVTEISFDPIRKYRLQKGKKV
ncbi:MAG: ATPase, T2SS/T4P/T4SS family [Proteus vulgaris]